MLAAENLVVIRAGKRILDGASIAVRAREIVTIEGASGGGKTTLLRALATLIAVDSGKITLDGVDVSTFEPRDYRTRVAYVPQHPPMLEGTAGDNVSMGPQLRGVAITDAAIGALLARAGLNATFRTRAARELSIGEKQRVAIARALANTPCTLLLDEPTSALDPLAAKHVLELCVSLAAEGLAVVMVTHVPRLSDDAFFKATPYVFESGKLRPLPRGKETAS